MKNKGFTLIELLAVIIILGVLMIIAVPAVTNYISNTRKTSYITSVKGYIDGTRTKTNALEYPITDVETTYYVPTSCISLEKGGQSPFGDLQESYVVVTYNGNGYNYYYTGKDTAGYGITLTAEGLLDEDSLKPGTTSLDLNIGVGDRSNIIEFGNSCKSNDYTTRTATKTIEENKSFDLGVEEIVMSTDENCFNFDESTGTIEGFSCFDTVKDVIIPKKINSVTVTTIGEYAFAWKDIYSIEIPNTVSKIENSSLSGNSFLYNIVNKTGKSFNWGEIIGYTDDESNSTFVTGQVYIDKNYGYNYVRALNVTNQKENSELSSLFNYTRDYITINDNKNVDVYYKSIFDTEWTKVNFGNYITNSGLQSNLSAENNILTGTKLLNKDIDNIPQKMAWAPTYPRLNINIKVEKNNKLLFATSFVQK